MPLPVADAGNWLRGWGGGELRICLITVIKIKFGRKHTAVQIRVKQNGLSYLHQIMSNLSTTIRGWGHPMRPLPGSAPGLYPHTKTQSEANIRRRNVPDTLVCLYYVTPTVKKKTI